MEIDKLDYKFHQTLSKFRYLLIKNNLGARILLYFRSVFVFYTFVNIFSNIYCSAPGYRLSNISLSSDFI